MGRDLQTLKSKPNGKSLKSKKGPRAPAGRRPII